MSDKVIVIQESLVESVLRDILTNVMLIAVVGLGVFLESAALQWIAGVMWIITVLALVSRMMGNNRRMTTAEAIEYLQERETK